MRGLSARRERGSRRRTIVSSRTRRGAERACRVTGPASRTVVAPSAWRPTRGSRATASVAGSAAAGRGPAAARATRSAACSRTPTAASRRPSRRDAREGDHLRRERLGVPGRGRGGGAPRRERACQRARRNRARAPRQRRGRERYPRHRGAGAAPTAARPASARRRCCFSPRGARSRGDEMTTNQ